ncbi:MAG: DUF1611 domain-containing protein [Woeseiaceae bacterium]|nr:DUF1611 domain-containing protein [Woeseiaceae bacterium]
MTGNTVRLEAPYLLFMGAVADDGHGKTGQGIAYWRPELCAGQMRLPGCEVDLGLPELDVEGAAAAGVRTAIIGIASTGGVLLDEWMPALTGLARAGIDIAAGTHKRLSDSPELVEAAKAGGARLVDVRNPPRNLPVGSGVRRSGRRVLAVGTDCAVGKKYTALALHRELEGRGVDADFRATGQTGIMIAGRGIPIDAVVADFVSGAAEVLSPAAADDHWDVIEGQGAILHPSYAGVTLGLLHGSQPDALVLCHDATRDKLKGMEADFPIPPLDELANLLLALARPVNPDCFWAGISVDTSDFDDARRADYLAGLEDRYGVPAGDPVAGNIANIVDRLLEQCR